MRDIFKGAGGIVAGIVFFAVIIFGSIYLFGGISQITADFRGETSKKNKVEANGDYRIAAYDHFFDLCASVQTAEDSIDIQLDERKGADAERKAQIDQNVAASRAQRAQTIRTYNQDARKSYTSGQFKASDLPFQLEPSQEHTTC